MADEGTLYRYTSNKDAWDTTASIIVAVDDEGAPTKVMHQGGAPVALTDEELARAKRRFNISKLSDDQAARYSVRDDGTAVLNEDAGDGEDEQEEEPQAPARRSRRSRAQDKTSPADQDAGGVVDPSKGGNAGGGDQAGAAAGDGQGSRGASGQDVGTTTGGSR